MTGPVEVSISQAREHVTEGAAWLARAKRGGGSTAQDTCMATIATAHFTAAMAITNILLADSDEWQGIPEEMR